MDSKPCQLAAAAVVATGLGAFVLYNMRNEAAAENEAAAGEGGAAGEEVAAREEAAAGEEDISGEAFTGVVGGHGRKADKKVNDGKSFLLVDGWLLKPFQAQAKVDSAVRFYSAVEEGDDQNLKDIVPRYGGTVKHKGFKYLKLENLNGQFSIPCCMDIKMGTRSYDDNATEAKKAKMIGMYPHREKTGFQVVGFKNYCVDTKKHEEWAGEFGKSLRPHTAITAFIDYLDNSQELRLELIPPMLEQLRKVKKFFDSNEQWEFIGSSLLIIFEADPDLEKSDERFNKVIIKMIDFAHVQVKPGQKDEGYLKGLNNVIAILESLKGLKQWDKNVQLDQCSDPKAVGKWDRSAAARTPSKRTSCQSKEGNWFTGNPPHRDQ